MPLTDAIRTPLSTVFGLLSSGASSNTVTPGHSKDEETEKLVGGQPLCEKGDFRIGGMTCGACVEVCIVSNPNFVADRTFLRFAEPLRHCVLLRPRAVVAPHNIRS